MLYEEVVNKTTKAAVGRNKLFHLTEEMGQGAWTCSHVYKYQADLAAVGSLQGDDLRQGTSWTQPVHHLYR